MESYRTHLRQARKYGWWRKFLATGRPFVARPVQRKRGRLCISRLYMGEHDRLKRLFSLGSVPHTDRCVTGQMESSSTCTTTGSPPVLWGLTLSVVRLRKIRLAQHMSASCQAQLRYGMRADG